MMFIRQNAGLSPAFFYFNFDSVNKKTGSFRKPVFVFCGVNEARTRDLMRDRHAL